MIKSISRNWDVYRNTCNVGVIYEYTGNNSFSMSDVTQLGDFLQQNKCYFELFILNVKGNKKYYVSFFYGERGYANNINNYDPNRFNERYNAILNLKPKIQKLKMFEGRIIETNLKLYTFGKEIDNLEYLNQAIHKDGMNYKETAIHNMLLKQKFSSFLANSINQQDYKDYILKSYFQKNVNFDFFNVDQAIFEPVLDFVSGNEYFLFPFYYSGVNQKTGVMEYQTLNITDDIMFLDEHMSDGYEIYLKKISLFPKTDGISIDKSRNDVVVDGTSSKFPLESIMDNQDMFFEMNHSLFLYTKKPDVSTFLNSFSSKFGTEILLKPKKITKEFNEMYLSHNTFDNIYHLGHIQNIGAMMKLTKEYREPNKRGAYVGKEYFSNNNMEINFFDIVGLDPSDGTLGEKANGFIVGASGSGKTYFSKKFVHNNHTDQIIIFDELQNFELMVNDSNKDEYFVMKYGADFPNIIGRISTVNVTQMQNLLASIVIGPSTDISGELKESIKGICNYYIEQQVGNVFKFDNFLKYAQSIGTDVLDENDKRVFMNKLLGLSSTMKAILNNDVGLFESFLSKQKIILSYANLKDEGAEMRFFIMSLLLNSVSSYLRDKRQLPEEQRKFKYSILVLDEAHQFFGKSFILDSTLSGLVREVRNNFAAIICISQTMSDFYLTSLGKAADVFYTQTSFHFILSPDQWEVYKKEYGGDEKRARIFKNLGRQIDVIGRKFSDSQSREEEAKRSGLNNVKRERFCVFGYSSGYSYYIINTNGL